MQRVLSALGPRGILINMSRGSVVDEAALIDALRKRTILAAGLDVFHVGEPKFNPALLELDNLTMFPHVGSASVHTRDAMGQLVVDNLVAYDRASRRRRRWRRRHSKAGRPAAGGHAKSPRRRLSPCQGVIALLREAFVRDTGGKCSANFGIGRLNGFPARLAGLP